MSYIAMREMDGDALFPNSNRCLQALASAAMLYEATDTDPVQHVTAYGSMC
jgi:hypothetical protein